jgi:hypothetical protein
MNNSAIDEQAFTGLEVLLYTSSQLVYPMPEISDFQRKVYPTACTITNSIYFVKKNNKI